MTKKVWLVFLTAAILPAFGAPMAGFGEQEPIDSLSGVPRKVRLALFRSQEERDKGEYESSARTLSEFLEKHPDEDHFLLHYHLGKSLVRCGRAEEALAEYEAAVRLEERFAQAWLEIGEVAYELGRYETAAHAILQGLEHSSSNRARLLYYAAACYLLAEKPASAVPLLEDLVSGLHGAPQMDWYRALISACLLLEDTARGRQAVAGMLQSFGHDPEAWSLAYQFEAGSREYLEAAIALTITGYLRPLSREERIQLGNLYNAIGVPAEAGVHFEEALVEGAGPEDFERLASAYLAAHDSEAALRTLTRALEKGPTVRLWSLLGDLHYMRQNYTESYEAFRQCADLDPEYGRAFLMMGYCALELGQIEDAEAQLARAAGFPKQEKMALQLLSRMELVRR